MKKNLNRRQFLKKSALGLLGAGAVLTTCRIMVSAPDMELPDPYPELLDQKPIIPPYNNEALFFNEYQYALVATLAALIIPTDDDPGATEAGVVDYIDTLVARSEKKQLIYTKGLELLDKLSQEKARSGKNFLNISLEEQIEVLRLMERTHSMRHRSVSSFLQRVDRKIDKTWDDLFGAGEISRFFKIIREDVLDGYFSNPVSWKAVGYFGPPQPVGYLDYSNPPSSASYAGSVRLIDNKSCLICHKDGRHPRGGLINHTCTICHRPHSPWPHNKDAFHFEDHIEFIFPSPDRKWR